jgi:hypothetical protein
MKRLLTLAVGIGLVMAAVTMAADQKFRADGTIQRVASDRILVRTPVQDIEIARDAKTKVTGNLMRGMPATVFYMKVAGQNTATEIVMGGAAKPK